MSWIQPWATPIAVLLSGLLIAGSIVFIERWEVAAIGYGFAGTDGAQDTETQAVYRLDRWTGHIDVCSPDVKTAQSGGFYYYTCPTKVP